MSPASGMLFSRSRNAQVALLGSLWGICPASGNAFGTYERTMYVDRKRDSLSTFKIRSTLCEADGHFHATVIVLPWPTLGQTGERESRILASRILGVEALRQMMQKARDRILDHGDEIG